MTTTDEAEDHWSHWGLDEDEIVQHSTLREDIPPHLETSLWLWVRKAVTVPETARVSAHADQELVRRLERELQVPIHWPFNRTDVVWAIQQAYVDRPVKATWRLVNWLLGYGHAHGGTLKDYLLQSGSAYTVQAADKGRCYLTKRVPEGVQHAATAAFQKPNAGKRLQVAWEDAFGVNPDASKAYWFAVKAVEDASAPVVIPNDSAPTLGKVISRMEQGGQFNLPHLREDSRAATHDVLLGMMRMLWVGQYDRHGGLPQSPLPDDVTQEEAESAVILAVTLVGWFESGHVQQ
ncbi:hypothetical protein ACQ86B_17095 [Mycolicibacterium aichiense]|uniref:hypothetical protein n=1 Tax=Mycolicibacterium aichiense TaxID=1799 RepID=UPI003D67B630